MSIKKLWRQVEEFDPGDHRPGRRNRRRTLQLLEQEKAALDRWNYDPGHITASGIVLSPDRSAILLVYHRRLGRWLQPGGHIDREDDSTLDAAAREVLEETGVVLKDPDRARLVAINVHRIPASKGEPDHLHHDLVWRFVAAGTPPRRPHERRQAVWCPVDGLGDHGADESLRRAVRRALRAR